ncbi:MAG: biopolymer transporter ExbD [Phycisphaerae bacterium]|jgi:biopolymer transport protein ExbD|nr:biopolymer transporter ExbD [Phycisphaerae bacterium]
MSPLIDCVFILLIFFIVTTTFVEETGVDVDKPQAASSAALDKNSIMIALTKEGDIRYGGRGIAMNEIRPLVRRLLNGDPSLPVIIEADEGSKTGLMIQILDEVKLAKPDDPPTVSVATRM